ncbi:hypothetical protein C1Y18_27060, partial [Pseudomonas sp. MPR-R5A]
MCQTPQIPCRSWLASDDHGYLHNCVATNANQDAKRAALDLALDLDLRRPVKPRWPQFDSDLGGKPAG